MDRFLSLFWCFNAVPLIPVFNHSVSAPGPQLALSPLQNDLDFFPNLLRSQPQYEGQMWDMSQCGPWGVCHLHPLCQHTAFCHCHNKRQCSFVYDEFRQRMQTLSNTDWAWWVSKGVIWCLIGCCHFGYKKGQLFGPLVGVCMHLHNRPENEL